MNGEKPKNRVTCYVDRPSPLKRSSHQKKIDRRKWLPIHQDCVFRSSLPRRTNSSFIGHDRGVLKNTTKIVYSTIHITIPPTIGYCAYTCSILNHVELQTNGRIVDVDDSSATSSRNHEKTVLKSSSSNQITFAPMLCNSTDVISFSTHKNGTGAGAQIQNNNHNNDNDARMSDIHHVEEEENTQNSDLLNPSLHNKVAHTLIDRLTIDLVAVTNAAHALRFDHSLSMFNTEKLASRMDLIEYLFNVKIDWDPPGDGQCFYHCIEQALVDPHWKSYGRQKSPTCKTSINRYLKEQVYLKCDNIQFMDRLRLGLYELSRRKASTQDVIDRIDQFENENLWARRPQLQAASDLYNTVIILFNIEYGSEMCDFLQKSDNNNSPPNKTMPLSSATLYSRMLEFISPIISTHTVYVPQQTDSMIHGSHQAPKIIFLGYMDYSHYILLKPNQPNPLHASNEQQYNTEFDNTSAASSSTYFGTHVDKPSISPPSHRCLGKSMSFMINTCLAYETYRRLQFEMLQLQTQAWVPRYKRNNDLGHKTMRMGSDDDHLKLLFDQKLENESAFWLDECCNNFRQWIFCSP
jgi:hypothetical protein